MTHSLSEWLSITNTASSGGSTTSTSTVTVIHSLLFSDVICVKRSYPIMSFSSFVHSFDLSFKSLQLCVAPSPNDPSSLSGRCYYLWAWCLHHRVERRRGSRWEHPLSSEGTGRVDTDCLRIGDISSLFGWTRQTQFSVSLVYRGVWCCRCLLPSGGSTSHHLYECCRFVSTPNHKR